MRPDVAQWLARACAEAEARGLSDLRPLLEGLARATEALRDADPALTGAAPGPETSDAGHDTD
jgi:hypothetical protein